MPCLYTAQGHFDQAACAVDFVHGGQGHDLARWFAVDHGGVLGGGEGADEVLGDLDEQILEGMRRVGCL